MTTGDLLNNFIRKTDGLLCEETNMRIHYLLDFTKGDHINIRICAVHGYEIEPIDIDCKHTHTAIVFGTEDGDIITFWKWTEKGRTKIGERKVKGYLKLKGIKRIDISKLVKEATKQN